MWETSASIDIAAPPEAVYRYLADFRRHGEWSRGVEAVALAVGDGPVGVGAEFAARERVPARFTSHTRVTALEPPRRLAWTSSDRRVMRVDWEVELRPLAEGTRLVQVCRWRPLNPLGALALRLVRKRQVPRENRLSLERLKAILDGQAAATA